MKKIIWIASYPKSGNTWIRSIISSLLYTSSGEFNFNLLKLIEVFEKKNRYKFIKTLNEKDYKKIDNLKYLSKYWQECQKNIVFNKEINPIYNIFKTHSANLAVNSNSFTSSELTSGIIYIVRDPREMIISYSSHMGKKIDETIDAICDQSRLLSPRNNLTLALMSSWNTHYDSWKTQNIPRLLIKYENLLTDLRLEITKICDFLGNILSIDKKKLYDKIFKVCETTQINKFRLHESTHGFDEASKNSLFFGNAKKDSWKEKLSVNQIARIEHEFNKTMTELGYLK